MATKALKLAPSLQHSFTYLLRRCADVTERRGLTNVGEFSNARESWILAVIAEETTGKMSQLAIAQSLNINPNVMVKLVDRMEQNGLIRRERSDERRQANYLEILPKGRKLYEAWQRNILENPAVVAPLTQKEREQLRQLLLKLAQSPTG